MWAILLLVVSAVAQTCENYGTPTGNGQCACPPGFGGATCSLPACGGNLFQGSQRTLQQVPSGAQYANISGCSCQDGWGGLGCNVCQAASACQSSYSAVFGTPSPSTTTQDPQNTTITCNQDSRVYSAGELSCQVINPTLQGLYPLSSVLNILRTFNPSLALAPNLSSFGNNGTVYAQLFYESVEQFYCSAGSCQQTAKEDGSSTWACNDLHCVCRPGTAFCGANPLADITKTINNLGGTLTIVCDARNGSSTSCGFQQDTLNNLFGKTGLQLSDCVFGECVRQDVIDTGGQATGDDGTTHKELSAGVIAGLAVVGALLLAAFVFLVWGCFKQRAAKKRTDALERSGGVTIEWRDVGYIVRGSGGLFRSRRDDEFADGKVILDGLSGRLEPGQMLAILGPSGAGKTTLVDILANKRKAGRATGSVVFLDQNGAPIARPRIGFVDQSDVLPPTLTVREALMFAARLRLPERISKQEKTERVFAVMQKLGLADVADTRIGNAERRGLSGGEMRRVSIGLELIARPDVLVLDEPTSGLDAVAARRVVNVLADIAHDPQNPTAVLASIHQPSSRIFHAFDRVFVLAHGREIYHGPGGIAPAAYFAERGLPCAEGYNVADHLLEIASEPPPELLVQRPRASTDASSSGNENEKPLPPYSAAAHPASQAATTAPPTPLAAPLPPKRRGSSQYAATFLTQFEVLCGREWKTLKRDKTLFVTHVGIAAVLGVFCGGLYFKTGLTIAGFQSRVGCLFFLGALIAFSSLSSLYYVVQTRPLFLRERANAYYSPTAWLLSRLLFDVIPLRIVPTIIVSTITYWMAGLAPHVANFFKFLLILVLYSISMTLFNFLLACIFANGGVAILLSALTGLYQMTFAGFFVHLNDIPPELRWLQWFDMLKYMLEALSVNEVGAGLQIVDTLEGVPINVSAQLIMNLLFGFGDNNYYRDVLILVAFILGFGVMVIGAVWFRVRETR